MKRHNFIYNLIGVSALCCTMLSCEKDYLPTDRNSLSYDMVFTNNVFNPVLGRNSAMNDNFSVGNSTQPLDFKIVNLRNYEDGSTATELEKSYPVMVWKEPYTGEETSLDEIKSKQDTQYRKPFEVLPHAANFRMWSFTNSSFIRTLPDSCYLFDVEVTNDGGGRVYFRDLQLKPYKERPFEPSNLDAVTGLSSQSYVSPTVFSNIVGDSTEKNLSSYDMRVYFNKKNSAKSTLTFRFLDKNFKPINPAKFAETDWDHLVHGFNRVMTDSTVTYDVAYPIPLVTRKTNYTTSDGSRAQVRFSYSRLGFGGSTQKATFGMNFAIYEAGEWEIVFQFSTDNPKFEND